MCSERALPLVTHVLAPNHAPAAGLRRSMSARQGAAGKSIADREQAAGKECAVKKVLITGAGSGFGHEVAMRLAKRGFDAIASVEIWAQVSAGAAR